MGLLARRQIFSIITDYQQVFAGERGGCVSVGSFSGLIATAYHANPSGHFPLGIQLCDIEYLDLSREYHPGGWHRGQREVGEPMDQIQICDNGIFDTDFIHVDGYKDIKPGMPAYLGPSGMLSVLSDWGGIRVGTFLSSVGSQILGLPEHTTHNILYMGGGLSWSFNTPFQPITIVNPTNIFAYTPGYCRVNIKIRG